MTAEERAALCVRACEGYPDHALPYGMVPALCVNAAENALCWLQNLLRADIAEVLGFDEECAAKFSGMIEELVSAVNLCKKAGEPHETGEEIEARCVAQALAARDKGKTNAS